MPEPRVLGPNESKTLEGAIAQISDEFPWVIERDRDGVFEVCSEEGPHPKGGLVYQKPAPVDPTKADYATLGRAVDATTPERPNVVRKANGRFVVCADDADLGEDETLVFMPFSPSDTSTDIDGAAKAADIAKPDVPVITSDQPTVGTSDAIALTDAAVEPSAIE